ncbi:MAG: carboxypeptidase regulatory-like domain-containing protein [Sedimentisphaerales bacterium]|nr:carboxypeptidase regulatory-like domain-containing protein [Sedimentisphaerales bacterium]
MKLSSKTTLMIILVSIFLINFCFAGQNENVVCSGRVINTGGEPVESVKVGFYIVSLSTEDLSYQVTLIEEIETDKEGKFKFETEKRLFDNTTQAIIIAQKEGFGLGWDNRSMTGSEDFEIKLYPAAPVAGVVVDESEKPVEGAEVLLAFLMVKNNDERRFTIGELMPDMLSAKTDEQGKFSFSNIPENAEFDFRIKKPGRATIVTLDMEKYRSTQALTHKAGKTDIKIVQPAEAILNGVVVEKDTGKPVSGTQVIFALDDEDMIMSLYNLKPAVTGQDGSFVMKSLPAKTFSLKLKPDTETANEWLSEPVEVTTHTGQTTSDVKIELIKGGLIEVLIKDSKTQQSIEQVSVSVHSSENNFVKSIRTDSNGIAKFRVNPGTYRITSIYRQDYMRKNWDGDITIDEGKTKRIEIALDSFGQFSGTVRDQEGNPLSGVKISTKPPSGNEVVTDTEGKFTFNATRDVTRMSDGVVYLLARDMERNLASAVLIDEKVDNYDIKLSPGIIIKGKVVDVNDYKIPDTNISLTFWISSTGFSSKEITEIDSEGNFEIRAVPENHNYSVRAHAEGYGSTYVRIDNVNADNARTELDKMVLKKANLSVSGIVVDEFDQPISDIRVYAHGSDQPNRDAQADKEGKFTIENLCEGTVEIQASSSGSSTVRLLGEISTIGGAKDIKIIVRELSPEGRLISRQPISLVSKAIPGFEHIKLDLSPDEVKDKQLLICFFDMEQRPSRNNIMQLKDKAQKLKEKDILVLIIHASNIEHEKLNEWLKEYEVHFKSGIIKSDSSTSVEKIRYDWGVKALPWLILTDKGHIVQAEGFSINELEKKLSNL